MVSLAIYILVSFLFLVSLLDIILNHPTKKFLAWVHSFLAPPRFRSSSSAKANQHAGLVTRDPSVVPSKERIVDHRCEVIGMKKKSGLEEGGDGSGFDEQKRMLFSTFDRNGDGFITREELRDSLRGLRIFMSDEEIAEIMTRSDKNGDGLIDFREFCRLLEDSSMGFGGFGGDKAKGEVEGGLKEAFDVFDKDKDGLISVDELGSVMCSLGLLTEGGKKFEDCKEMIRKVDMDGDGMVNFDEFKKMMMPSDGAKLLTTAY